MIRNGKILAQDLIESWPEIFGEVKLNVLPLQYMHTVLITFKDGKIWEVKITAKVKKNGMAKFEELFSTLIQSYEISIDNVDFKIDIEKVKKDITKLTDKFLKKTKLI